MEVSEIWAQVLLLAAAALAVGKTVWELVKKEVTNRARQALVSASVAVGLFGAYLLSLAD